MRLRDLGEGALIRRIRERFPSSGQVLGIGDDAALLPALPGHSIVFCCDLMVEGTHFLRNLHPPESVGYKAVAVNVSDVGAMGGLPAHFVISLAAPGDLDVDWIDQFYNGVKRASEAFGATLVGGDTSSANTIFVDVAMVGHVPVGTGVTRGGAKPGDKIYVTGTLGGSVRGFEDLRSGNLNGTNVARHLYPEPRHRVGAAVARQAHAMTDVSDGLSTDLSHIVAESGVSARIYKDRLPIASGASSDDALHGGEEYELIIVAPALPTEIEGVKISEIGEMAASSGEHKIVLVDGKQESVLNAKGWDHYSSQG